MAVSVFLAAGLAPVTVLELSRRTVTVRLTPSPEPQLTVLVDFRDGSGAHQALTHLAPQPVPATYIAWVIADSAYGQE
ncbi:hypothetical protein [Streptomyces beijiangensis]|uniref:hypothetical protein n=1 Tax=Streptomyces beijiangensis TaxID=163361 RepID=UPI0031E2F1B8